MIIKEKITNLQWQIEQEIKSQLNCPICGGDGFTYRELDGLNVRVECECGTLRNALSAELTSLSNMESVARMNIPELYRDRVVNTDYSIQPYEENANMILYGNTGAGKTTRLWSMYYYAVVIGRKTVKIIDMEALKDSLINGIWNSGDYVGIDDFGNYELPDWLKEKLLAYLSFKTSHKLPLWITTNCHNSNELAKNIGQQCASRVWHDSIRINMSGKSYRNNGKEMINE